MGKATSVVPAGAGVGGPRPRRVLSDSASPRAMHTMSGGAMSGGATQGLPLLEDITSVLMTSDRLNQLDQVLHQLNQQPAGARSVGNSLQLLHSVSGASDGSPAAPGSLLATPHASRLLEQSRRPSTLPQSTAFVNDDLEAKFQHTRRVEAVDVCRKGWAVLSFLWSIFLYGDFVESDGTFLVLRLIARLAVVVPCVLFLVTSLAGLLPTQHIRKAWMTTIVLCAAGVAALQVLIVESTEAVPSWWRGSDEEFDKDVFYSTGLAVEFATGGIIICVVGQLKSRHLAIFYLTSAVIACLLQVLYFDMPAILTTTTCLYMVLAAFVFSFIVDRLETAARKKFIQLEIMRVDAEGSRRALSVSERLLLNTLPLGIAKRMHAGETRISQRYSQVGIMFMSVSNFEDLVVSRNRTGLSSVPLIHRVICELDVLMDSFPAIEKVKTIGGPGFLAVSGAGLASEDADQSDPFSQMAEFALLAVARAQALILDGGSSTLKLHVGLHSGDLVGGVFGKTRCIFDVYGDSVNVASRLMSNAPAGQIHVSQEFRDALQMEPNGRRFAVTERGPVFLKGKGVVETCFLEKSELRMLGASQRSLPSMDEAGPSIFESDFRGIDGDITTQEELMRSQIRTKFLLMHRFVDPESEAQFREQMREVIARSLPTQVKGVLVFLAVVAVFESIGAWEHGLDSLYPLIGVIRGLAFGLCCLILSSVSWRGVEPRLAVQLQVLVLLVSNLSYAAMLLVVGTEAPVFTVLPTILYHQMFIVMVHTFLFSRLDVLITLPIGLGTFVVMLFSYRSTLGSFNLFFGVFFPGMIVVACVLVASIVGMSRRRGFLLEHKLTKQQELLRQQQQRAEGILYRMFPASAVAKIKRQMVESGGTAVGPIHELYERCTVVHADIVHFTSIAAELEPDKIVALLDQLYSKFDVAAARLGVEKLKTLGDAVVYVSGVPVEHSAHARLGARLALELISICNAFPPISADLRFQLRVGVATAPVVGGFVGSKKMMFDCWGAGMEESERLETLAEPGGIRIDMPTYILIRDSFECLKYPTRVPEYKLVRRIPADKSKPPTPRPGKGIKGNSQTKTN